MSYNAEKADLRRIKTDKALKTAMLTLLSYRSFNNLTVSDLCKEALVSRATFYSHYTDKYDLLRAWLADIKTEIINMEYHYDELEAAMNQFIYENRKVIKNILQYADSEVLEITQDFMSHVVGLSVKRNMSSETSPNHTTLLNFCTGGLMQLLLWQVKNNFPAEVKMINNYLHEMLECITEWDASRRR